MRYGTIPGVHQPISRLVLGSGVFGDDSRERLDLTFSLLDAFLAMGGTMVDTAYSYGGGGCERAIGAWLKARGRREDVLILTKGAHFTVAEPSRVTPKAITSDLLTSLQRMHTDYIDLYLLHRDDPTVPVGPLVDCLNEHAAAGRMRAFGGSNWTVQRIDEANDYAAVHGLRPFVASSPNLSLAKQKEPRWPGCVSADDATLAWHRAHQFPLFSWSSQAGGFFSGRFRPDDRSDADMVRTYYTDDNWERLRRAQALAQQKRCSTVQIALAWVLHQTLPVFAIIGPANHVELNDSVSALDVSLTPHEVAWLNLED